MQKNVKNQNRSFKIVGRTCEEKLRESVRGACLVIMPRLLFSRSSRPSFVPIVNDFPVPVWP
jgi:hypothetical protein